MKFIFSLSILLYSSCAIASLIIPDPSQIQDMTPVTWYKGKLPDHKNITQQIEMYTFYNDNGVKLLATLPELTVFDFMEELMENQSLLDFSDIKKRKLDILQRWINNLPSNETTCENSTNSSFIKQGYTGKTPQTVHNINNVIIKDSRKLVESTRERSFLPQAIIKFYAPGTTKVVSHASAFFFRKNAAITAAHCVYDNGELVLDNGILKKRAATGWDKNNIKVCPAYDEHDTFNNNFKEYKPVQIIIPKGWINSETLYNHHPDKFCRDIAVLIFGENIANDTGSLGLAAVIDNLENRIHPLHHHIAYTGGYPATLGAMAKDKVGENSNKAGIELEKLRQYGTLFNTENIINNGTLINHLMDVTPGQSGAPIMPHYPGILNYLKESYAMGITSHGNHQLNKGVLITEEILRWVLEVSDPYQISDESSLDSSRSKVANRFRTSYVDPWLKRSQEKPYEEETLIGILDNKNFYQIPDESSLYSIEKSELLKRIKRDIIENYFGPLKFNNKQKKYGNFFARLINKMELSDKKMFGLHKINHEVFSNDISSYCLARLYEKKQLFNESKLSYQNIYINFLKAFNLKIYKPAIHLPQAANFIPEVVKHGLFRLGCYLLRGIGRNHEEVAEGKNHDPKKAYWLFYLGKQMNHRKSIEALESFVATINTKYYSLGDGVYNTISFNSLTNILANTVNMFSVSDKDIDRMNSFNYNAQEYYLNPVEAYSKEQRMLFFKYLEKYSEQFNDSMPACKKKLLERVYIPFYKPTFVEIELSDDVSKPESLVVFD